MTQDYERIRDEVAAWPGISVRPYEFGGVLFAVDHTEIGHMHTHGMLDLVLLPDIKAQLVAEGRATEHHILPKPDRASFFLVKEGDALQAVWLLKVSYFSRLLVRPRSAAERAERVGRVRAALPGLELSAPMSALFERLLTATG